MNERQLTEAEAATLAYARFAATSFHEAVVRNLAHFVDERLALERELTALRKVTSDSDFDKFRALAEERHRQEVEAAPASAGAARSLAAIVREMADRAARGEGV